MKEHAAAMAALFSLDPETGSELPQEPDAEYARTE